MKKYILLTILTKEKRKKAHAQGGSRRTHQIHFVFRVQLFLFFAAFNSSASGCPRLTNPKPRQSSYKDY